MNMRPSPLNPTKPEEQGRSFQYVTGIPIVNMEQVAGDSASAGRRLLDATGIFLWRARPEGYVPSDDDFTLANILKEAGITPTSTPQKDVQGESDVAGATKGDGISGKAAATIDAAGWNVPADARALLLSPEISNPIYNFLQLYVIPKVNGADFGNVEVIKNKEVDLRADTPEGHARKVIDNFLGASTDWLLPIAEGENRDLFDICLDADLAVVAEFLRCCMVYFYPIPLDDLLCTVETFRLDWATVMHVIREIESRDLQLSASMT